MWRLDVVADLDHLERLSRRKLVRTRRPAYLFRGQAVSSWPLVPKIARPVHEGKMTREEALAREREILDRQPCLAGATVEEFAARFPCGVIEWLAALQHQRVETRLLDWTRNPLNALFFAVREPEHWKEAGAIWLFHPKSLQRATRAKFGFYRFSLRPAELLSKPHAPDQLFVGWPVREVERCRRQHGEFTWCARIDAAHDKIIDDLLPQNGPGSAITHEKWIIPAAAKPGLFAQLQRMGISHAALLPGDEGDLAAQLELERALARYSGMHPDVA